MADELNELITTIETHFKNCLWNNRPPIKEMDFQLVVLSQKIIELRDNLDNVKDVDKAIAELMTFIEATFHIPLIEETEWISQNNRHQLVWDIYSNLSNLRTF